MNTGVEKYKGLWPVMLTPFHRDGSVDYEALDQLTDFYLSKGATGLFAICLSSEMNELTESERISIVKNVVTRVNGRVPVAASVTFGGKPKKQAEFAKKITATGADVGVLITGQLTLATGGDAEFLENVLEFTNLLPGMKLGLYECPVPYKRIIPVSVLKPVSDTGRFYYLKDTTCDTRMIAEKINTLSGTSLSLFNANTPTALESLRTGADGLSPISANFYPEFYSWMIKNFNKKDKRDTVEYLNDQLTLMDAVTRINYPMSAKFFLARRGLPIECTIRTAGRSLNYEEIKIMDKLFDNFVKIAGDFLVY